MKNLTYFSLFVSLLPSIVVTLQADAFEDFNVSIRQNDCDRVRKEVSDLSQTEWREYVRAVQKIHETPSGGGDSVFSSFIRKHAVDALQWHGGQYFLPAHRQMIWEYENALRQVNPDITLPYYDWSINNEQWPYDIVWRKVGGANGGAIPLKPFFEWRSPLPSDHLVTRTMVYRQLTNGFGETIQPFESRDTLDRLNQLSQLSFQQFATFVEIIHGLPHVQIGGDMRDGQYSPSDPVFYLHHAFIDKIWRDWQLAGAGNKFDGVHRGIRVSTSAVMRPSVWGRTVSDILNGISTCVRYQEPISRSSKRAFSAFSAPAEGTNESSIAESKARDGESYKKKVELVKNEQDAFKEGAAFSELPQDVVQDGLEIKKRLQAEQNDVLAKDIDNPDGVLSKDVQQIESDGAKEAATV